MIAAFDLGRISFRVWNNMTLTALTRQMPPVLKVFLLNMEELQEGENQSRSIVWLLKKFINIVLVHRII